jgi:hypothetical protein
VARVILRGKQGGVGSRARRGVFEITPTMVAAYARVKGGRPIRVRDPIILADALRDAVAALVGKSKDAAHKRLIGKPK